MTLLIRTPENGGITIETAFTASNWASVLDTSKEFLDEIAPNMY